jgi:hypothetical protein
VQGGSTAVRGDLARLRARLARDPRFGPGALFISPTEPVTLL